MAEFVFKNMVKEKGIEGDFLIESRATSAEELGNPVYPPARRELLRHGIICEGKLAAQISRGDAEKFDLLVGMDDANISNMKRMLGDGARDKIYKLLDFASGGEVADPWYTGDFSATWRDVNVGCRALLDKILKGEI
jgi:protein-tyrosine phosphatase